MKRSKKELTTVGKNLTALRTAQGWSQADLARELGIDPSTLCCWESGFRKVDLFAAVDLAKIFGLKVETVVGKLLVDLE